MLTRARLFSIFGRAFLLGLLIQLGTFCLVPGAHAGRLLLLGGLNFTGLSAESTTYNTTSSYERKVGHLGGVELGLQLAGSLELGIGASYVNRVYGTSTFRYSLKAWEIPVLLRFLLDRSVAVQGGGYWAKLTGFVNSIALPTDSSTPEYSFEQTYESLGMKSSDYGAILGLHVTTATPSSFAFDLRYVMSLANTSSVIGSVAKFSSFQVLLSFPLFGTRPH